MSEELHPCPLCGSTTRCESTCVLSGPMNNMRDRTIRVYIDEAGDEYLNAKDVEITARAYLTLTSAANGPMQPMTQMVCQAVAGFASVIMAATSPDSKIRVLASDIDTSVPDTVPSDWLNDAPGGQS
jgi:hypothetical protein